MNKEILNKLHNAYNKIDCLIVDRQYSCEIKDLLKESANTISEMDVEISEISKTLDSYKKLHTK